MVTVPDRHLIDIAPTGLTHTKTRRKVAASEIPRPMAGPPCRPLLVARPDSPMLYSRGSFRSDFRLERGRDLCAPNPVKPIQKLKRLCFRSVRRCLKER